MKKFIMTLSFCLIALGVVTTASAKSNDDNHKQVQLETTMGEFIIELYNETPMHRDNFIQKVKRGFYDGLLFHRVIEDFMIQGGDPTSRDAAQGVLLGEGGDELGEIPAEFALPTCYHKRGAVAAARAGDDVNPEKKSSACQFYIVYGHKFDELELYSTKMRYQKRTKQKLILTEEMARSYRKKGGTPSLDGQYTVFGQVVKGMKVVKKIQKVQTDGNDRPLEDVRILKATVIKE